MDIIPTWLGLWFYLQYNVTIAVFQGVLLMSFWNKKNHKNDHCYVIMNMCTVFNILYAINEIIHTGSHYYYFNKFEYLKFCLPWYYLWILGGISWWWHCSSWSWHKEDRMYLVTTLAEVCFFKHSHKTSQTFSIENVMIVSTFSCMRLKQFHLVNTFDNISWKLIKVEN